MKDSPLETKSLAFAKRILDMSDYLMNPDVKHRYSLEVAVKQITRSGTSIGANIAEGASAQSKADMIAKYYVAFKESTETRYWLTLLRKKEYIDETMFNSMYDDLAELIKMLISSLKTLIENNNNNQNSV